MFAFFLFQFIFSAALEDVESAEVTGELKIATWLNSVAIFSHLASPFDPFCNLVSSLVLLSLDYAWSPLQSTLSLFLGYTS